MCSLGFGAGSVDPDVLKSRRLRWAPTSGVRAYLRPAPRRLRYLIPRLTLPSQLRYPQELLCNVSCGFTVGGMTRPEVRTLRDAAPLAALAHPFRSRIMDALKVDGPSTASMLAARTGQAVGNASHHLKVLAAAGLVEEAPELARDRRERWWRLVTTGTRWSRRELIDQAADHRGARRPRPSSLRRQQERVRDWMANAETDPEWEDAAFATQNWLRLSPDELGELSREIVELLARWGNREVPDDGVHREPVLVFARGFPSQP